MKDEDLTQDLDSLGWQLREVGQGACLDFAILAIALTKKDSGRRLAIGYAGDVHTDAWTAAYQQRKPKSVFFLTFTCQRSLALVSANSRDTPYYYCICEQGIAR